MGERLAHQRYKFANNHGASYHPNPPVVRNHALDEGSIICFREGHIRVLSLPFCALFSARLPPCRAPNSTSEQIAHLGSALGSTLDLEVGYCMLVRWRLIIDNRSSVDVFFSFGGGVVVLKARLHFKKRFSSSRSVAPNNYETNRSYHYHSESISMAL
ncbi:hypothetical protein BGY98DRAFT_663655 [Russula aff. rugulosa BPL654]|nr:hypothetical protein BGY98DRAFT_663655 [Russula aff. rugulosa BPL654]